MSPQIVLREKLRLPEASGLVRSRLVGPLREIPPAALGLVVAPAGSGKTTLLAWVAHCAGVPVGWYRMTSDDDSEVRLVAHLTRALSPITGICLEGVESMADLLSGLDRWDGTGGMLILDDVHEIGESPAERELARFVAMRPHRLRLIFGSRRLPDVNAPRLLVSGAVHEISSEDLRFRYWEVEELFEKVYDAPLTPTAAALLTRRTGGWAAGLKLFHLATAGRNPAERHRAVAELGGRSKLIRSYLARNVLADLPEEQRRFLLRTSTLGHLTATLCDALLNTTGSGHILDELEQQQLFTSSDDEGMTFRYHEVLRTHLETELVEEYGMTQAREWYLRSASLLESEHEHRAAAFAYAKAENWAAVARLLQEATRSTDAIATIDDLAFPPHVLREDPWLALAEARRRARMGALRLAYEAYRHAQTLCDEPEYQSFCRREREAVELWQPPDSQGDGHRSVESTLRHWSWRLCESIRTSPTVRADSSAGDDAYERLIVGLVALISGDLSTARTALSAVPSDEQAPLPTIVGRLALAVVDVVTGVHCDPATCLGEISAEAEREGLPWIARLARGIQEAVLIVWESASWRLDICADLARECDRSGDAWGAAILQLATAISRSVSSDRAACTDFEAAAERFRVLGAQVAVLWCLVLSLRANPTEVAAVTHARARRALTLSRKLRVRGAEALALMVLCESSDDGNSQDANAAREHAAAYGLRLPSSSTSRVAHALVPAPKVEIRCFDGFRLDIERRPIDLSQLRPQARTLLHILSLDPDHDIHRELLEEALWPDVDHKVACHRLQVAVSSIRALFENTGMELLRRGDAYRLCLPPESATDVREFERALSDAAAASARGDTAGRVRGRQAALALYTGDLLPEDGPAEHVAEIRGRLRRAAADAAAALAADYRDTGDATSAHDAAQMAVRLNPYQDPPWLLLIDLHEEAGDTCAAELVRREYASVRADLDPTVR